MEERVRMIPVKPSQAGIDAMNKVLENGGTACIRTVVRITMLSKEHIGYVTLAKDGRSFLAGYNRKETILPGYLWVQAGA
jgi:hypothetical protein